MSEACSVKSVFEWNFSISSAYTFFFLRMANFNIYFLTDISVDVSVKSELTFQLCFHCSYFQRSAFNCFLTKTSNDTLTALKVFASADTSAAFIF